MTAAARKFFDSLRSYADLASLVAEGETEGLYLECKSPSSPQLNRDLKVTLAKAISGFSNTSGGVLVWGASTTKHQHGALDVVSQLEPIAHCANFMRQVNRAAITASSPRAADLESRAILEKEGGSRGLVLTYIPQTKGDPVRSNEDDQFYVRSGDEFTIAPYELVKRLFAATDSPDLSLVFGKDLVKTEADGTWKIPLLITNRSSAVARDMKISVTVKNPTACAQIALDGFNDASAVNPGVKIFIRDIPDVLHRGLNTVIGFMHVQMKKQTHAKRALRLRVSLYANQMRARSVHATVSLAKKGFSVTQVREEFMY
jgi:hypothetical protein